MRSPFTHGRLYAAMALSAFVLLLWHLLPQVAALWLTQHTWLSMLMTMLVAPYLILGNLVSGVALRLSGLRNDWLHFVVMWAGTLPLSYGYVWVGSVVWRAIRKKAGQKPKATA